MLLCSRGEGQAVRVDTTSGEVGSTFSTAVRSGRVGSTVSRVGTASKGRGRSTIMLLHTGSVSGMVRETGQYSM